MGHEIKIRKTERLSHSDHQYTHLHYDHPDEEPGNFYHVIPDNAVHQRMVLYNCDATTALEICVHEILGSRKLMTASELAASRAKFTVTGHEKVQVTEPGPDMDEYRHYAENALDVSKYREE